MSLVHLTLPGWAVPLVLIAHFGLGLGLGTLYFANVWWSARQFGEGGRIAGVALHALLRLALLGGVLALASLEGALPLLLTALGVVIARVAMVRRLGRTEP